MLKGPNRMLFPRHCAGSPTSSASNGTGRAENDMEGPVADARMYKGNDIPLLVNQVTDLAMNTENLKRCRDVGRKGYAN